MERFQLGAAAALTLLVFSGAATAQDTSSDAAANWAGIVACAQVDDTDRRQDCVEDVMRRAGLFSEGQAERMDRDEFGLEGVREEQRRAAALAPARSAAAPAPVVAASAEEDELETTIAAVRSSGYRRWTVTTAEGAIWEQTQAEDFLTPPKIGERFTIERAAMGSYRCKFGNSRLYRCSRIS